MRKKLIKVLIFVLLFTAGFWQLSSMMTIGQIDTPSVGTYSTFYKEPDNSIQIVSLGNSRMLYGWNSLHLWESTGYTSYSLASSSQPAVILKYLMEEVRKTQENPLFIIDVNCFRKDQLYLMNEEVIRRVTDAMPYSMNRKEMIDAALEFYPTVLDYKIAANADDAEQVAELKANKESISNMEYYWKLLKYHSKWEDLRKSDFTGAENLYKSVLDTDSPFDITPLEIPKLTQETTSLNENQTDILNELLSYVEENQINVLFISLPASLKEDYAKQVNQIMNVLTKRGYNCLNFNTEKMYEQLKISFKTDFCDSDHVNVTGSKKLMEYMADYLSKNYDLIDKREDASYESWNKALKDYKDYVVESQQED